MNKEDIDEFKTSATYAVDSDGDDSDNDDRVSVAESEQSMVSEAPIENDNVDDQRPPWLPFPVEETDANDSSNRSGSVQTNNAAPKNAIAIHASQSRGAVDSVIERVLARSIFANIPMRKVAANVYFFGARRVTITESGDPAMPHVKSGRFDGSLEDFIAQNGKTEIVRIRGLKAAIDMMSQPSPTSQKTAPTAVRVK